MVVSARTETLVIKATKGSGLESFKSEDFAGAMFQANIADGQDINKAVRMKNYVAALGARGDYIELIAYVKAATAANVPARNCFYVEAIDYTAVPTAVQHTVFGEMSHFKTPKSSMQETMLDGIDVQHVGLTSNNVLATTACKTAVSQKLRGEVDSRVSIFCDTDDAWTVARMKIKPNSDGVFLLRAGDIIWSEPDATFDVTVALF